MAWTNTPVNAMAAHSTTSVSSFGPGSTIVTSTGNAVVIASGTGAGVSVATIAVSDSLGNTYANGHTDTEATNDKQRVSVDHAINLPSGKAGTTSYTMTPSVSSFCVLSVLEFTGGGAATLETAKNAAHSATVGGETTVANPGSITPANANDLYVSAVTMEGDGAGGTVIFAAGSGWTKQLGDETSGFQNLAVQTLVGSGAQSGAWASKSGTAPAWSWTDVLCAYAVPVTAGAVRSIEAHRPAPWKPSTRTLRGF
jgi:hypothetical protein